MKKRPYLSVILHVKNTENITWPRRAGRYKISPRVLKKNSCSQDRFFKENINFLY